MQYLAYRSPYGKSGKRLAYALGLTPLRDFNRRLPSDGSVRISWAAHCPESLNGEINWSKLNQLQQWNEAGLTTLNHSLQPNPTWLGRSGSSHGGGDFLGFLTRPTYWTKPVTDVTREWRVHVCRKPGTRAGTPSSYQVIRLGYKVNEDPSLNKLVAGVQIRSRQFGWKIKYLNLRELANRKDLSLLSRWSLSTIGWDFGAVDVLETGDGRYHLLEANSAPGLLDDKTLEAYRAALEGFIG